MTILPKSKKTGHLNIKPDRYSNIRGHVSPSSGNSHGQEHYRFGGVSPSSHSTQLSGIDVTSGAMSSVGPTVPNVAGKRSQRKHASNAITSTANVGLTAMSVTAISGSSVAHAPSSITSSVLSNQTNPGVSTLILSQSPSAHGKNDKTLINQSKHMPVLSANTTQKPIETYNSDDEYGSGFRDDELELRFAERLKKSRGLIIKEVKGDGACMFRAVADQVYGDEEMHVDVRTLCMDYIAKNRDHFSQFLTEDFDEYLARKRESDAHGNHVELQAISEIFLRSIEIFEYSIDPINTFHPISPEANTGGLINPPLRLSYHGTVHYNSVKDPFSATIGIGLGLPEFKPGLADNNLMKEATLASEAQHIEEAMLNDKLRMTDWERTEEEISKQIAKDSYMEYLRQLERGAGSDFDNESLNKHNSAQNFTGKSSRNNSFNSANLRQDCSKKLLNDNQKLNAESKELSSAYSPSTSFNISSGAKSSGLLGSKRGASSPNIPCCSHDESLGHSRSKSYIVNNERRNGTSSPVAKIQRDDWSSSSLPNIGLSFGASMLDSNVDLMKPSTSASSLSYNSFIVPALPKTDIKIKETNELPGNNNSNTLNASQTSTGLYEELLAASALVSDDWNSEDAALNESSTIARVLALSQQEFFESMKQQQ